MRGGCHSCLLLAFVCLLLATSSTAQAQAWLGDRSRTEGHGISVGNLELHPGIGAELGYTDNVFYATPAQDSAILRLSPHLLLSTVGDERRTSGEGKSLPGPVAFRGGLSGSLQKYFATALSDSLALGGNADLQVVLNPQRPVSFQIIESLHYAQNAFPNSTPETASTTSATPKVASLPNSTFGRTQQNIGGRLLLASSGGLLRTELGYRFGLDDFTSDVYMDNRNSTHTVDSRTSWEFLPKTALFHEASYTYQSYIHAGQHASSSVSNNDQVGTRVGINGAVTSTLAGTAAVGYIAGFYRNHNDFENVTLLLDGRYVPAENTELGLAYAREAASSFEGNYVQHDRIYVHGRLLTGGTFLINGKAGVEFLHFGRDAAQMNRTRADARPFVDVSGEYRFVNWLAATAQLGFLEDISSFSFIDASTGKKTPVEFTRYEGWLGLRAFY